MIRIQNRWHVDILLLLGCALLLRVVGIKYGLPALYDSDEPFNVINALGFGARRTPEPIYFVYPTLFFYFLFGVYGIYFVIASAFGVFDGVIDFAASYFLSPTGIFLVGRCVNALLGTLTIYIVYRIGKDFFNRRTGFLAASLLTFSFTHADVSHWVLLEAPVACMSALALYFIFRYYSEATFKKLLVAGLLCGLAISVKYNAGFLILALLAAAFFHFHEDVKTLFLSVVLGGTAVVFGFLLGSPYWIVSFSEFASTLQYTASHVTVGMVGHVTTLPFIWPLWELVYQDWTVGLVMLAGFIYAFTRRVPSIWIMQVFCLATLIVVGLWQRSGLHYLIPLYPALVLLGGIFLDDVLRLRWPRLYEPIFLFVIVMPAMGQIAYHDLRLMQQDTRTAAQRWIERNIPSQSLVAYENYAYGPNLFDARRFLRKDSESGFLPESLKKRLREAESRRISYRLINLRKDFRLKFLQNDHALDNINSSYIRQLLETRLPKLSSVRKAGVNYLIASSENYQRYFDSATPEAGTPLWYHYQNGRRFYQNLFSSEDAVLLNEFHPSTWRPGPTIRIYKLKVDADGLSE